MVSPTTMKRWLSFTFTQINDLLRNEKKIIPNISWVVMTYPLDNKYLLNKMTNYYRSFNSRSRTHVKWILYYYILQEVASPLLGVIITWFVTLPKVRRINVRGIQPSLFLVYPKLWNLWNMFINFKYILI